MRGNCLNQSKEEKCIGKRTENKNNTKETSPVIPIIIRTIKGLNLPFKNKDYGGKNKDYGTTMKNKNKTILVIHYETYP